MSLRKLSGKLHLYIGLTFGIFFLIGCLTGTILVFEEEGGGLFYPSLHYHQEYKSDRKDLSLDQVYQTAQDLAYPEDIKTIVVPQNIKKENLIFVTDGSRLERSFYAVNPYTGKMADKIKGNHHIFSFSEELHRKLLMGSFGKTIVGLCSLFYMILFISGFVIWLPKKVKNLKQRLQIKFSASRKRVNWDLHSVGGFYILPFLLIMIFTSLNWSYDWFKAGIHYAFDGKAAVEKELKIAADGEFKNLNILDYIERDVINKVGINQSFEIKIPEKNDTPIEVSVISNTNLDPNGKNKYYYHPVNGKYIMASTHSDLSLGTKASKYMKALHTGNFGGIFTQILYFLVSLFGVLLPITGLYIWLGRKKNSKKKKPAVTNIKKQTLHH